MRIFAQAAWGFPGRDFFTIFVWKDALLIPVWGRRGWQLICALSNMRAKILLVDDEPDTRKTYSDLLESEGYEVTTAGSGEEALKKINGYRPDLILLDIMLPGRDGVAVARELSLRSDTVEIPVVMVTALHSFPTGRGLSQIPGIRRFIYKPCRPRTLLEGVEDALRYHR
jgi:two-component system phosphate regulon response regulator PhoB